MMNMDFNLDDKESINVQLLVDNYIGVSSEANIFFKSDLERARSNSKLSKEDSLFILLHTIYKIKNFKLGQEKINSEVMNLINRVKVYNSEGKYNLKYSILFNKQYKSEMAILIRYIEDKYQKLIGSNNTNGFYINTPSMLKKYPIIDSVAYKLKKVNPWLYSFQENIINSDGVNNLEKRESEKRNNQIKEKQIKEKQSREIQIKKKREKDRTKFYSSKYGQNWAKFLKEKKLSDQNKRKNEKLKQQKLKDQNRIMQERKRKEKEFNRLIKYIKEYNDKPIKEWIKNKPDELYNKLSDFKDFSDSEELIKFKSYFESLDKYYLIKNEEDSFKRFINILSVIEDYLDYEKREKLKDNFSDTYILIKDIDKLFLKKLYSEINYLKNFINGYTDLLDYTDFQKTNDDNIIKKLNQRYIDNEIFKNKEFFEDISDPAKKAAILIDEKNIKVIAGAGTGKTFTIQSKVKYLIETLNVKPEKVLCLCYTHKSASELNKRANGSLKDSKVEVCTFHEFARRVDRDCGGVKSTNRYLLDDIIRNYIKKIIKDPIKSELLLDYFTYYINPNDEEDSKTVKQYRNKHKYITLQQKFSTYNIKKDLFDDNEDIIQSGNSFQQAITYYCNLNNKTVLELIEEANFQEEQGIEWKKRNIGMRLRKFFKTLIETNNLETTVKYFKYVLMLYKYFDIEIQVISNQIDKFVNLSEIKEFSDSLQHEEIESIYYQRTDETLQGEKVRSLGEFIIANYLFMHNINYEYEKRYEHNHFSKFIQLNFFYSGNYFCLREFSEKSKKDIVESFIKYERRKSAYKPDFYLPDYDIYLEHFGINEKGEATWLKGEEKEKYEQLVHSKRVWHKLYGTKLIETYSYYVRNNTLIEKLEELLKQNNVIIGKRDSKEILEILLINNQVGVYNRISKLIKNFINIFEANHFSKNSLNIFKRNNKYETDLYTQKRQELFLNLVIEIYDIYYKHNQSDDIDHNREISNALNLIKTKKYKRQFDYIFIDEYQDINFIRCELIQELQKNSNSKIFVVGDDWQSIYGFSGSDVNLFINFEKYFPNCETIKLSETRRNSQKLSDIAKEFIEKNDEQETKNLNYFGKNIAKHPVRLVSYSNQKYSKSLCLDAILNDIILNNRKDDLKVLILGRMNKDIDGFINNRFFKEKPHPKFRKIVYSKDENLDITFMSIHQSKGLEYDEVIVLNFEDDIMGFPSQIVDDPILKFVKKNYEKFPFAEERRLLYVALTRTKHNVYLVYPDYNRSRFIRELKEDFNLRDYPLSRDYNSSNKIFEDNDFYKYKEVIPTDLQCPGCEDGKIAIIILHNKNGPGKHSIFVGCSDYCKNYIAGPYLASVDDMKYIEKCPDPECEGILVRQGDILKCSMNYHGGCMQTKELKLDEEDLKYKDYEE